MRRRTWVLLVVPVLAGLAGLVLWLAGAGRGARRHGGTAEDELPGACAGSTEPAVARPREPAPAAPSKRAPQRPRITEEQRERARALHAAVRQARERSRATAAAAGAAPPAGATPQPAAPSSPAPPGTPDEEARGRLDPQYIRDAVQELRPLIAECYEMALAEQADLEGSLVVEFTIEGDEQVGGVVEDTRIADTSTLTHPTLDLCMRETLYTLRLPAPEGSGSVHVRYPFRFARSAEGQSPQPVGR